MTTRSQPKLQIPRRHGYVGSVRLMELENMRETYRYRAFIFGTRIPLHPRDLTPREVQQYEAFCLARTEARRNGTYQPVPVPSTSAFANRNESSGPAPRGQTSNDALFTAASNLMPVHLQPINRARVTLPSVSHASSSSQAETVSPIDPSTIALPDRPAIFVEKMADGSMAISTSNFAQHAGMKSGPIAIFFEGFNWDSHDFSSSSGPRPNNLAKKTGFFDQAKAKEGMMILEPASEEATLAKPVLKDYVAENPRRQLDGDEQYRCFRGEVRKRNFAKAKAYWKTVRELKRKIEDAVREEKRKTEDAVREGAAAAERAVADIIARRAADANRAAAATIARRATG